MNTILKGITISKAKLVLDEFHMLLLKSQNIHIHECKDHYILYYGPKPHITDSQTDCYFKGVLSRVRSDEIYNAYNDDYDLHYIIERPKPLIKIKMKNK